MKTMNNRSRATFAGLVGLGLFLLTGVSAEAQAPSAAAAAALVELQEMNRLSPEMRLGVTAGQMAALTPEERAGFEDWMEAIAQRISVPLDRSADHARPGHRVQVGLPVRAEGELGYRFEIVRTNVPDAQAGESGPITMLVLQVRVTPQADGSFTTVIEDDMLVITR
jgi:hypothetical protein